MGWREPWSQGTPWPLVQETSPSPSPFQGLATGLATLCSSRTCNLPHGNGANTAFKHLALSCTQPLAFTYPNRWTDALVFYCSLQFLWTDRKKSGVSLPKLLGSFSKVFQSKYALKIPKAHDRWVPIKCNLNIPGTFAKRYTKLL